MGDGRETHARKGWSGCRSEGAGTALRVETQQLFRRWGVILADGHDWWLDAHDQRSHPYLVLATSGVLLLTNLFVLGLVPVVVEVRVKK